MKRENRPPTAQTPSIAFPTQHKNSSGRCPEDHRRRQLALRTSVSSTSVTVITSGAGCSITSTATVSTTGATGCFTFRAVFFTGAGFGLAVRFVAFADFAALRALPRLAEFTLRSFPRFCTFDPFLRLAMIDPLFSLLHRSALMRDHQVAATDPASYHQISA
jgi:hypothetical protein